MKDKWKIANSVGWLLLALTLVISCSLASAAEKQDERIDEGIAAVTDNGTVQAEQKKKPVDGFTWAIVGISLGAFGSIAHLKFSRQKGREKMTAIEKLSLQMDKKPAVDWSIITRQESADPMEANVDRLAVDYEEKVSALEARKKAMIAETSKVAVEIMRIWG
jgi:hypothetical protein